MRVWGSTSPDVLSSVFPNIYNTESRAVAKPQHCFCVCKGRGGRGPVWCLFYPYTKHLLGALFLVTPSCGAAALSIKTSTYVPARRCESARTRKKRGWGGCVYVRRGQKFHLFQSQVISLSKQNKSRLYFYSLLPACFPWSEFSFLSRFSSFISTLALRGEEEKKVCGRK